MEECKTFSELRLFIQYVDELLAKMEKVHDFWKFVVAGVLINHSFNTIIKIAKMRKFLNPAALLTNKNKQQAA